MLIPLALIPVAWTRQPSFKVAADFIKVPVSVFDSSGRPISDLKRQNFALLDEGEPRPIENFILDEAPLRVMLLLDASGSLREELQEIRQSAVQFGRAFSKEDRICAFSFSDELKKLQGWTNRWGTLKRSLRKLKRGYRTALYDALHEAISKEFRGIPGRQVIILLTDGLDNESTSSYESVVQELIRSNITLYIVSRTRLVNEKVKSSARVEFLNRVMKQVLDDEDDFVDVYFREKETAMKHLAETTGGTAFFPRALSELGSSYSQVGRELKTQYVLTFRPPVASEKRFRHIQVACDRPIGRIHYRKQYSWPLATSPSP
ncbi:MAG: VWA domain-containing protein [Acidobacteriota bacterium]